MDGQTECMHIIHRTRIVYILSGKQIKWKNFVVATRVFDMDHRLLMGNIKLDVKSKYKKYLKLRNKPNIEVNDVRKEENELLMKLQESKDKGKKELEKNRSWILDETFRLLKEKMRALRIN